MQVECSIIEFSITEKSDSWLVKMVAQLFRAVAFGLLFFAIVLHVVGIATHYWVVAKLDPRGVSGIMSANGMSSGGDDPAGMDINMGLWKYCMKVNLQFGPQQGASDGSNGPSAPDEQSMDPQSDSSIPDGQSDPFNGWSEDSQDEKPAEYDFSPPGETMAWRTDTCPTVDLSTAPDWMKAVQALGILSLIAAGLGAALAIYSCIGESKGDRARLLPFITGGIVLAAGVLLLIAVVVYGTEFNKMMEDQMSMMGSSSSAFNALAENVKQNTSLGFSFVLETLSGCLMVLSSLVLMFAAIRDQGNAANSRGTNMAI